MGQMFSTCDINPVGARATPQLDLCPQVGRVPPKKGEDHQYTGSSTHEAHK